MAQPSLFPLPEPVVAEKFERKPRRGVATGAQQLPLRKNQPPFCPGAKIRGKKDSTAAEYLRRLFGRNSILLARPCEWRDGEWWLFDRPAAEFKPLNDAARMELECYLRDLREMCATIRKEDKDEQEVDCSRWRGWSRQN